MRIRWQGGRLRVRARILPHRLPTSGPRNEQTTATLGLTDKFRLARQVLSASIHVQGSPLELYTGIKPNDIVLSRPPQDDGTTITDAVLIYFEQRSAWCSWSPPEVYYLEFLKILAGLDRVDEGTRAKYVRLLQHFMPLGWSPHKRKGRYEESGLGYTCVWQAMGSGIGSRRKCTCLGNYCGASSGSRPTTSRSRRFERRCPGTRSRSSVGVRRGSGIASRSAPQGRRRGRDGSIMSSA